jgi:hypothetical protein
MIKALKKLGRDGIYLNIIKIVCKKAYILGWEGKKKQPISAIMRKGKKLKPFTLRSGKRQGCPFSPVLLNIVLGLLARAIR